jgi:hypothetical protein
VAPLEVKEALRRVARPFHITVAKAVGFTDAARFGSAHTLEFMFLQTTQHPIAHIGDGRNV